MSRDQLFLGYVAFVLMSMIILVVLFLRVGREIWALNKQPLRTASETNRIRSRIIKLMALALFGFILPNFILVRLLF